jgi:hypothetical protein
MGLLEALDLDLDLREQREQRRDQATPSDARATLVS